MVASLWGDCPLWLNLLPRSRNRRQLLQSPIHPKYPKQRRDLLRSIVMCLPKRSKSRHRLDPALLQKTAASLVHPDRRTVRLPGSWANQPLLVKDLPEPLLLRLLVPDRPALPRQVELLRKQPPTLPQSPGSKLSKRSLRKSRKSNVQNRIWTVTCLQN